MVIIIIHIILGRHVILEQYLSAASMYAICCSKFGIEFAKALWIENPPGNIFLHNGRVNK